MKKLLALLLALVMVLSFAACNNNEQPVESESESQTESENQSEVSEPETTAASYKLGISKKESRDLKVWNIELTRTINNTAHNGNLDIQILIIGR